MALKWPDKDADEVLDYTIDWSQRLGTTDTIATSTWIVPNGIAFDDEGRTATTTTVWLSAGVLGDKYEILNRIDTAEGRTMDQTVSIKIRTK